MVRFERSTSPLLLLAIALSTAVVFWADDSLAQGITVWVFYLVPMALTLFARRPAVPLAVAAACSALIVLGMYVSPAIVEGMSHGIVRLNRTFGIATLWLVALVGRSFILARARLQEQDWLRTGQRELGARLQGELSVRAAAENALAFLCGYLDAQVGALYVAGPDGRLSREAAWALPPGAALPATVAPGEGVLGQAAKEDRLLRVDDVPEGVLPMGSALGRGSPRHLVAAPARADGVVKAVVELGFAHPPGAADLDLLAAVAEPLGVALRSAQYRARLEELLAQTQQQAEELQAQQEELRVANEELQEQSTSLRESQVRLEAQQAELEQTNTQLEEQAQALEERRDELARAQGELQRRADELARANQYKNEFLANMSHELRTPLNSSLILARLLADNREGNLTPEQVRHAEIIWSSGNDLLALINDILDLSRIEAGQLELQVERTPVDAVLEPLERLFAPVAQERGVALRVETEPGIPAAIDTDPRRLQQILKNLLSNAFKFTERGEVALRVRAPSADRVAFEVRDTGIGIPADKQEVIFEAFRQADGSTHRRFGGTGLGLSISRDLARRLGGDVTVQSEPGRGSTFRVGLPVHLVQAAPPRATSGPPPAPAPGHAAPSAAARTSGPQRAVAPQVADDRALRAGDARTLLVVEDDRNFARILYDLAHEQHFRCLVATTAAEGLALAREQRPGAILLDVNLPDQSGLAVLEQLKADAQTRHIPVHVVSVADHARRALEMGAVGYLLKPVARADLEKALGRLEALLEQKLHRVLVVEDVEAQRESLRALLGAKDVDIVAVGTAQDALRELRAGAFDCVVMDLGLPDMSGYELLEQMAADEAVAFPPVIVYTGRELSADEEHRLQRSARSIVIKGARSPERLLDEASLFLHRVESSLPEEQRRILREARSREAVFEGRRILLAEDDVRNIFALSRVLEPRGARLEIARNGREALEALERAGTEGPGRIDLVLMDVMMPVLDGLAAMREIRRNPAWQRLPIIALTAKAMPDDRERCLEAGASDYIAKPLDVDKLLSLLRVWMPRPGPA